MFSHFTTHVPLASNLSMQKGTWEGLSEIFNINLNTQVKATSKVIEFVYLAKNYTTSRCGI